MKYGRAAKIGTAPIVKMLKVARRPILSDTAAQPNRPTRFPDQNERGLHGEVSKHGVPLLIQQETQKCRLK